MINGEKVIGRSLRWGMIGGGKGSNIGNVHRSAALRDANFQLLAGAFDIDPARGTTFAGELGVSADRSYPDYLSMLRAERQRDDAVEVITIATPNSTHYAISKACLEAGFHVVCEKPLCFTYEEAQELEALACKHSLVFGVTYGYSGHQLLRQARAMIENGELGDIRIVNTEFPHDFFTTALEEDVPSLKWRMDPKMSGPSSVLGDVGTHALHLVEILVPNFKINELLCVKQSFIKSRVLEDNANVMMKCDDGIFCTLWACGVNAGRQPELKIRVIGSKGSLEWMQLRPNELKLDVHGKAPQIIERGTGYLHGAALAEDRIGGGHAEGLFESWANIYRRFAQAVDATQKGDAAFLKDFWYPSVREGAEGVKFVEKCVESADQGSVWIRY